MPELPDADVHAGALAHGFQAFQNLDGTLAIGLSSAGLIGVDSGLEVGAVRRPLASVYCFVGAFRGGNWLVFFGHV